MTLGAPPRLRRMHPERYPFVARGDVSNGRNLR
jgi:hypothetical protein